MVRDAKTIWKDLVRPGRMHSLGQNGEEKLRGHPANWVHLEDGH